MSDRALAIIKQIPAGAPTTLFGVRLSEWLIADLNSGLEDAPAFTESRVKALLRATDTLDDPTRHHFETLGATPSGTRMALFDLLSDTGLDEEQEVAALAATSSASSAEPTGEIAWLSLIVAAHAWKREYPLYQLDPASPPSLNSPAGQILTRAAHFVRRQVQRTATNRDKLSAALRYAASASGAAPGDDAPRNPDGTLAPVVPYYRPPVPVNYPEVANETLHVDPETQAPGGSVERGEPLIITTDDLAPPENPTAAVHASDRPVVQPPITITPEQIPPPPAHPPSPLPRSGVIMPGASQSGPRQQRGNVIGSLRQRLGPTPLSKSTKLRVIVQEYPDGPGLYGLQVRVSGSNGRSYVAGTTDRDGRFVAELPVPETSGMTYDVDVTWPREAGGETEQKSITLHADRTHFDLPFYQRLSESG